MGDVRFYRIKDEIRILGVDDAPFERGDDEVMIVGVVFRGGTQLDGVMTTRVRVDGLDATGKLVRMVKESRFKDLRVIMLDGLGFGGFNMVDIKKVHAETGLPVIAVVRDKPDLKDIEKALDNLPDKEARMHCIRQAGKPFMVETGGRIYAQAAGLAREDATRIIRLSAVNSNIPEPLRVAHLIAAGVVLGESKGKA